MEIKMYMGEDDGSEACYDNEAGPGAIIVETLLNIRTVASLTIENKRLQQYTKALERDNSTSLLSNGLKGGAIGLGFILQLWVSIINHCALHLCMCSCIHAYAIGRRNTL